MRNHTEIRFSDTTGNGKFSGKPDLPFEIFSLARPAASAPVDAAAVACWLLLLLLAGNQAWGRNADRNPPVHNCTCPWSFSLVPVHAVHFSQWREGLFLGAFPTSFHGRFPLYVFMTTDSFSISVGDKQLSGCYFASWPNSFLSPKRETLK